MHCPLIVISSKESETHGFSVVKKEAMYDNEDYYNFGLLAYRARRISASIRYVEVIQHKKHI